MQKTKLGITVGLLGAIVYFSGLFSGSLALIIAAGYVLLQEENEWLRKTAVKAVVLSVTISVLVTVIGLIPDAIGIVESVLNILHIYISIPVISSVISVVTSIISFLKTILFVVLGLKALNQGTINIPVVDDMVNKYM